MVEVTVNAPQTTLTASQVRALMQEVEGKETEAKQVKPGMVLRAKGLKYQYLILSADQMRHALKRLEEYPNRVAYIGLNAGEIDCVQTTVGLDMDQYTPVTLWEGR